MSDETHALRTIDWRSVFPFTQLFRAFRVAIHPAKMGLALIAILLVYGIGRTMDGVWLERHLAVPNEIGLYEESGSRAEFAKDVTDSRQRLTTQHAELAEALRNEWRATDLSRPTLPDAPSDRDLKRAIDDKRDHQIKAANDRYDASAEKTSDRADARDSDIRAAYAESRLKLRSLASVEGQGLCLTFIDYETLQINQLASDVIAWDWTSEHGVFSSLRRFIFTGPGWAISKHPLFFTIFFVVALLVWSVIGGAIARIAAVHVSQDEKISVRQALRFSSNKLMSFFAAPVMPLILIGAIALILALLGVLTEIPYVGGLLTIIYGALFFVLIGIGVMVACALVGWVCGFGLMYPTIAVEGSDAFDAVSRSISYVFARPWKVFIYSVISLVYGAVTYLFLRFMAFLTLTVIHECLTFWTRSTGPAGRTSIANVWTGPTINDVAGGPADPYSLTFAENLGSGMLMFWTWLFVALLAAYLLSFFVSANTIMYYLLRHEVDATDIDDVYLEPNEDEFEDALPETATGTATTRSESVASVPASAMTERMVGPVTTPAPEAPVTPPVIVEEPTTAPPTPPPAGS